MTLTMIRDLAPTIGRNSLYVASTSKPSEESDTCQHLSSLENLPPPPDLFPSERIECWRGSVLGHGKADVEYRNDEWVALPGKF